MTAEDRYCNSMLQFAKSVETKYISKPEYIITFYTGGGDNHPTCTLCGAVMHSFSSCTNKKCSQYKNKIEDRV